MKILGVERDTERMNSLNDSAVTERLELTPCGTGKFDPTLEAKIERLIETHEATPAEMAVALRQSQQLYQQQLAAIEAAMDGIAVLNQEGEYIYLNKAHVQLFGYSCATELVGKHWHTVYYPNEIQRLERDVFPVLLQAGQWRGQSTAKKRDGSTFTEEISLTLIEGVGLIRVCRDITERQRTEEALQQSESRFQKLTTNVPGMIYQYQLSPDGSHSFTYASPGCRDLFEREPEQIQANAACIFDQIHPDDRPLFEQSIAISAETLQPWNCELRLITPSGQLKWIQGQSRPEKQANGAIVWDGLVMDITKRKRTEEELQASYSLLHSVLESTPDLVFVKDVQGRFIMANSTFARFLGKSIEDVIGQDDAAFLSPEIVRQIRDKDLKIMKTGMAETFEEFVPSNGLSQTLLTTKSPWYDREGTVIGLIGIARDISDRMQAEQALRWSEERYRSLVIATSQIIWDAEAEGLFVTEQPQWSAFTGQTFEEYRGVGWLNAVHPDDQPHTEKIWSTAVAKRTLCQVEYRLRRYDGVYRYMSVRAVPVLMPDGRIREWVGVHTDITERKQAEQALRRSETKFRMLYESTSLAVLMADENGIFDGNRASVQLFGGSHLYDLCGYHFAELSPSYQPDGRDSRRLANELIALAIEQGNARFNWVHRRMDGSEFPAEVWLTAIDMGNRTIVQAVIQDLTEQKQAEAALRASEVREREKAQQLEQTLQELRHAQTQLVQTEKMSSLGQLVAGVAHEINNPVNFIYGNLAHASEYTQDLLGLVELYHQHYAEPAEEIVEEIETIELDFLREDLPKLLSSIKVGAERIREIVQSLRNFSRLDEAQMKKVDIHEGIESTLMILQNRLKAKPDHPAIQVVKEYGNLPKVECYAGQLNQVFMNLLTNAIDALDEYNEQRSREEIKANPSTICIQTQVVADKTVAIRIIDNGLGMTEKVKQRLFDPFFTTKPIGQGTGLGLSISYQIVVEKHCGQLSCQSQLGKGTEFVIEIPLWQKVTCLGDSCHG